MVNLTWQHYTESEDFATKADFNSYLQKKDGTNVLLNDDSLTLYKTDQYPQSFYCVAIGNLDHELDRLNKAPQTTFMLVRDNIIDNKRLEKVTDTYSITYNGDRKEIFELNELKDYDEVADHYISTHAHHKSINKKLLLETLRSFNLKELRDEDFVIWLEDTNQYYETSYFKVADDELKQKELLSRLLALGAFEMELNLNDPACLYLYEQLKPYATYECSLYRISQ